MQNLYLLAAIGAYAIGIVLTVRLTRTAATRAAGGTAAPRAVVRAAYIAATIAAFPAVFFATFIGGNLGRAAGFEIANALALAPGFGRIFAAGGLALGIVGIGVMVVVTSAVAAAVFMKVFLASRQA